MSVGALAGLPATIGAVATKDSTVLVVSRKNFLLMQKQDSALGQKLLLTLLAQKEANRPGRTRTRVPYRDSSDGNDEPVPIHGVARKLLAGDDYKISLTDAQVERFSEVFDLIVAPGETEIPMDAFSRFVSMEARLLGSGKHSWILIIGRTPTALCAYDIALLFHSHIDLPILHSHCMKLTFDSLSTFA